jgi:hypothetical protein
MTANYRRLRYSFSWQRHEETRTIYSYSNPVSGASRPGCCTVVIPGLRIQRTGALLARLIVASTT